MPEITNIEVPAMQLKKDDELHGAFRSDVTVGKKIADRANAGLLVLVTAVSNGNTNTTVETDCGRLTIHSDSKVQVGRSVKTEAEKEEEELNYIEHLLDRFVADMRASATSDPMQFLNEKMQGYSNDVAQGLSWYVEDVMKMSHRKAFAAQFIAELDHDIARSLDDEDESVGRKQVFLTFCKQLDRALLQEARTMSRSTNAMSNLSDDCKLAAIAQFLDDFTGGVGYLRMLIEKSN